MAKNKVDAAKKRRRRLPFILAALALVVIVVLVIVRRPPSFAGLRGDRDFNVILITVDTLRADRVGCYGFSGIATPTMDLFASRGVRFERCIAQTPLTLPSHTTILTGTLPPLHGVRDNGGFVVPAELTTIAEAFKARGYATAAFVGAYVLDSKWGLDQGFDAYFDRFDLGRFERISLASVQRPANEVIDAALPWIEEHRNGRFFAWIHLYDPHSPYEPPAPYSQTYADRPYLGEIAFTDAQLARLWESLDKANLVDNLFLVFASDHGESLGEHEESTHGFFVYQEAVHVPLIVVTPFRRLWGGVSPQVVSLADIMPTVCEMAALPAPPRIQGRSLVPLFFRPESDERTTAYAETFYPRYHFGWSELRSLQDGRYKLIQAPVPELYDLEKDPDETKNLVYLEKDVFARLSAEAEQFNEAAGRDALTQDYRKVDEDTRERLAALGYVGAFMDQAKLQGRRLANPRDKIGVFNAVSRARELGMGGNAEEGIRELRAITAEDPEIGDAWFSLGNVHFRSRDYPAAIEAFRRALDLKPDDTFAAINIANAYQLMGRPDEAEAFVLDYLKRGFEDPQLYFLLGNLNFQQRKFDRAEGFFRQCLSLNKESASSENALAAIAIERDDLGEAERRLQAALAIDPHLLNVHFNLAQTREKQGRPDEAEAEYLTEIAESAKHYKAMFNLAHLYRQTGRADDELRMLQRAVEANPDFPLAYFYLARNYLNRGTNYEEALALAKKGLELGPNPADLPLGYFLLADLYNRLGDERQSREFARRGQEAAAALSARR